VHETDLFPTFARIAGGKVPTDRIIDGVDQTTSSSGKRKNLTANPWLFTWATNSAA
jgi:hypothetical protein